MATDTLALLAAASPDLPTGHGAGPNARQPAAADAALPADAGATADAPGAAAARAPVEPEIMLATGVHRDEIVKRLRRAEGQLRGVIRMLEEGQGCLPISQQLTAVRKALDATMARIAIGYLEQEMADAARHDPELGRIVERVGLLVGRLG